MADKHWYMTDLKYFAEKNKGIKPYQGWSNSATWCFNLYFLQERSNYQALLRLIRKDGTINQTRAIRLFNQAGTRLQVDEWCEGNINIPEILENFETEMRN